ncbi:MAG: hypothetical protein Q4F28_15170 [Eubacteriales bacterium]|nr:hypothetical protein [Eubacteriales bacterium]
MAKRAVEHQPAPTADRPVLNSEQQHIVEWLKKVRFQKQLFGGVSEQDVWKKIDELNKLYEAALAAERIRYETLLETHQSGVAPPKEGVADGKE